MQISEFNVNLQWFINSYGFGYEGSREVNAKPMEALKKLGHEKLKLDEYESTCTYSTRLRIWLRYSYPFRANRVRGDPSRRHRRHFLRYAVGERSWHALVLSNSVRYWGPGRHHFFIRRIRHRSASISCPLSLVIESVSSP